VIAAGDERAQEEPVTLWQGRDPAAHGEKHRLLEVSTASGARWLSCARVQMGHLTSAEVWQLPPLLRSVLHLPHVVGVAEVDNELHWLVDLSRFAPDKQSSQVNQSAGRNVT
jgi:hypothetical protein